MSNLYILIIGYGSIGKKHASIINQFYQNYKIVIVSKHKKSGFQKKVYFENSLSKALKKYNFFAAMICSPSTRRLNDILTLLNKKIHILVEKPIFNKIIPKKKIKKIKSLIIKNKIVFQVGYLLRFHPIIKILKKEINNELKKNNYYAEFKTKSYLPKWRHTPYKFSVSALKQRGGGVLNELSHEIDLTNFIFGSPKKIVSRIYNSKKMSINVEDVAEIIFKFNEEQNICMHLDFNSFPEQRTIELKFKNFSFHADLIKNTLKKKEKEKEIVKKFNIDKNYLLQNQFMYFLKQIKNKVISTKNFNEALEVVKIIDKIKKLN